MSVKSIPSGPARILQIGNYPPPVCGWSIQTKMLTEELRAQGHICEVLNINENRKKPSTEYVTVENGLDYILKLIRYARKGFWFQVHVNGQSKTGYALALIAAMVGRLAHRPVYLSWRGGLQQKYFPCTTSRLLRFAYRVLFGLSGRISCNNATVKAAIEQYGIEPQRVAAIAAFSARHLEFKPTPLAPAVEQFLQHHEPVFVSYVAFRPEYRLDTLRDAMAKFRRSRPHAGVLWVGFTAKELPAAQAFVSKWPADEQNGVLVLGNVSHDEFLTLVGRSHAVIRTPVCDGVSASVLEALGLGVPVVASENGNRPATVTTYGADDSSDLCAKLISLTEHYPEVKTRTRLTAADDNISRMVDWLLTSCADRRHNEEQEFAHAT